MKGLNLNNYLDRNLVLVIEYILQNPSIMGNNHRSFSVAEILDMPTIEFKIHSQHLFAFMSSAFSPGREERAKFIKTYPETKSLINRLEPNRKQYAIILFNIIRRFDPLAVQIVRHKISKLALNGEYDLIIDTYEDNSEFRLRKAIYLASPPFLRAKIIMIDQDPKIQALRHHKEDEFDNSS